jgi:hypothetical protein
MTLPTANGSKLWRLHCCTALVNFTRVSSGFYSNFSGLTLATTRGFTLLSVVMSSKPYVYRPALCARIQLRHLAAA